MRFGDHVQLESDALCSYQNQSHFLVHDDWYHWVISDLYIIWVKFSISVDIFIATFLRPNVCVCVAMPLSNT